LIRIAWVVFFGDTLIVWSLALVMNLAIFCERWLGSLDWLAVLLSSLLRCISYWINCIALSSLISIGRSIRWFILWKVIHCLICHSKLVWSEPLVSLRICILICNSFFGNLLFVYLNWLLLFTSHHLTFLICLWLRYLFVIKWHSCNYHWVFDRHSILSNMSHDFVMREYLIITLDIHTIV